MPLCKSINCTHHTNEGDDFCISCSNAAYYSKEQSQQQGMSTRYPKYYKDVGDYSEIDVYAVHHLFDIKDPSGCIQHASKKLLLSGVRTGGKSVFKDISEARDTLSRWLQLNPEKPEHA